MIPTAFKQETVARPEGISGSNLFLLNVANAAASVVAIQSSISSRCLCPALDAPWSSVRCGHEYSAVQSSYLVLLPLGFDPIRAHLRLSFSSGCNTRKARRLPIGREGLQAGCFQRDESPEGPRRTPRVPRSTLRQSVCGQRRCLERT
jgi:hypothetical protein